MINTIFLCNPEGEYRIKRSFTLEKIDLRSAFKTKLALRNFFRFEGKLYVVKTYKLVKIVFVVENENPFITFYYIDSLFQLLNAYFSGFSESNLIYNYEEAYYMLDSMFLDGKLIQNNRELILDNTRAFFRRKRAQKS